MYFMIGEIWESRCAERAPVKLTSGQGKQHHQISAKPSILDLKGKLTALSGQGLDSRFYLLTGTRELLNLRENEWRASHNASFAGDPLADRDSEQTSSRRGYRRSASKLRSIIRRTSVAASDALMSWQSAGRSSQWGTHATRSRRGRDIL
ncbi:hypothetical protein DTO207G8_4961 [Paecilomyces variotii]|nr:hypothetical protein DTO207G8_4961 [Paecilomyces variotii]KAJ9255901.1 hypothetical protein DTO195F2_6105 [Paecilomyces variotii]